MSFWSEKRTLFRHSSEYMVSLLKWVLLAVLIGLVCGFSGVLFHYAIDIGNHFRENSPFVLFALPVAGVVIVFLYHICHMDDDKGTSGIVESVRTADKISAKVAPLIIVSTALTHFCGGSAGREGAALQIGGSLGSTFARGLKMKKYDASVFIMCGMSGVFSAVFGTPITAAIFALEVSCVGVMQYSALLPVIVTAITAKCVALAMKVEGTYFLISTIPEFDIITGLKVLALAVLVAILSIVFVVVMHETSKLMAKYFPNRYLRIIIGAFIVIALTLLVGNYDYNGAGTNVIVNAVENGTAANGAFILKLLFTAITLGSGFKGGEIVPTFFVGSTFGVFAASFLGLNPSFAAAIGLVALFCGVVNCPVASIILSVEIFGAEGLLYFAMAAAVSYLLSGKYSLYSTQKFSYSKLRVTLEDK